MQFRLATGIASVLLTFGLNQFAFASEAATAEEVMTKVAEGVGELSKAGAAGLEEFNKKDGKWVWKDTYLFVIDCKNDKMAAHPTAPQLIGKPIKEMKDKAADKPTMLFQNMCDTAAKEKGGWVEYTWTKPGAEGLFKKYSFVHSVPGTDYQIGAGIYDDKATLESLNAMIK